jgi:Fur family zinc uptake transcriptional regulator
MSTVGFSSHDHSSCKKTAIAAAEEACKDRKVQLTPVRRRVLEILLEGHKALGAYDVLDVLRREGLGSQPPVAYRALDFLVVQGFAHRIEKLNAYIACAHPEEKHNPAFLICSNCDAVAETASRTVQDGLDETAAQAGFRIERTIFEAEGICPNCDTASE